MTMTSATRTLTVLVVPILAAATAAAHAENGGHPRSARGYTALKVGGYDLDRAARGRDSLEGLFVGLELGSAPSRHLEFGLTADWLRRRDGRTDVLIIETPYELPVEGVVDLEGTSTDLVPLGGILRLRFPVANDRLVPFISGQLTYDFLRLAYHEVRTDGNVQRVDRQSEYFHGWGTTVALGLEARLDSTFGLLFEAGVHESEPTKGLLIDGTPLTGRVNAGGDFARLGVRFDFQ
jgi:hypothetical protein